MATDNSKPAAAAASRATGGDDGSRVASAAVEELIIGRWSPRSFSADPLSDAEIASLFEGARWAPSSFNGQPWLFLYETDGPDRPVFDSVLMPRNRAWASKAPLVGFIFANTRTPEGREPPRGASRAPPSSTPAPPGWRWPCRRGRWASTPTPWPASTCRPPTTSSAWTPNATR